MTQSSITRPAPFLALSLGALVLITGCLGNPADPASRLQQPPVAGPVQVEFVELTPANIAQHAWSDAGLGMDPAQWVYRVGLGDTLAIHIYDVPELTVPNLGGREDAGYRVDPDGAFQFPWLGRIPAAGLTTDEIRAAMVQRLRGQLPNPQVEVRVAGFHAHAVSVVGEVRQPSRQRLTAAPLTVIDAINAAGGLTDRADRASVHLLRNGREHRINLTGFLTINDARANPVLMAGDVLRIPERSRSRAPRAHLTGAESAAIDLDRPVTLAQALQARVAAAEGQVYVFRRHGATTRVLNLSLDAARTPDLGGRIMLDSGDVVHVQFGPADHATTISRALPRAGALMQDG
jgi:polysaccharide export outer membrane protein